MEVLAPNIRTCMSTALMCCEMSANLCLNIGQPQLQPPAERVTQDYPQASKDQLN